MDITFNIRSFFQRLLGKPATQEPGVKDCYQYNNGKLVIDLQKTPELKFAGGSIRLEGGSLPVRVLVVHGEDGEYRAYKNQCTHFGHRRLDPVPGTNTVQCCSINKSTFTEDGEKILGPAPHSITGYPVEHNQETLTISLP